MNHDASVLSWSDILYEYLEKSNEDECVLKIFNSDLNELINSRYESKGELDWLEIGPGPGTKTESMIYSVCSSPKVSAVKIYLLEPDFKWYQHMSDKVLEYKRLPEFGKVTNWIIDNRSLRTFIKELPKGQLLAFNFVSINHVIYSEDIVQDLLRLIKIKKKRGSKVCTFFLTIESENSDFAKIRLQLQMLGIHVPGSALDLLLAGLRELNIIPRIKETENKVCELNYFHPLTNVNHWIYPFLLGCSKEEFLSLKQEKRQTILNVMNKWVADRKSTTLLVPDKVLIFKTVPEQHNTTDLEKFDE